MFDAACRSQDGRTLVISLMTSLMTSLDCLPHQDGRTLVISLMTSLTTSLDCLPHQDGRTLVISTSDHETGGLALGRSHFIKDGNLSGPLGDGTLLEVHISLDCP